MSHQMIQLATGDIVTGDLNKFSLDKHKDEHRVFYEVGYYNSKLQSEVSWTRTGKFIEIPDTKAFIDIGQEDLKDEGFIDHHNFLYL